MIAEAIRALRISDEQIRLGKRFYVNARRRGLGVARACYVAAYALGLAAKQVAHAFSRSLSTLREHFTHAFRILGIDGRGQLGIVLMQDVSPAQSRRTQKGPHDHPLRPR